ncbi:ABC transporter permease [Gangjinia marincola]|uniref:ABC transporter permease n=1 Tax=Gangjinia marincola TaxID=578463 RepID=A0ABP3XTU5_9FLAO
MLRLLNIEFHKLKYSKSARVLTITYFILITFIALFASIKFEFGMINFRLADQGIFNFPLIWHFNAYFVAFLKLFLAIVIVSMMSNEYSNRTLKQNLIDGLSKKEFILSKFYTVLVYAGISAIFLFVVSLILGLAFSDYTEFSIIIRDLEYIPAYFVKLTAFFSMCLFLGMLVKRSAFALGFLVVWWIAESILKVVLGVKIFDDFDKAGQVMQFFPLESMANLVVEPISRLGAIKSAANQLGSEFTKDYGIQWYQIVIALAWTAIFIYLSYALLKKRDL